MPDSPAGDQQFNAVWRELLDDLEATADAYREEGWDVHELTVGDVTARYDSDRPYGLSVLVPDSAFRTVDELAETLTFESVEVYRRAVGPLVLLLVVERSPASKTAIFVPLYYNAVTDAGLVTEAEEAGEMRVHVRSLGSDHEVTFAHDDPSLFVPDSEDPEETGE